MKSFFVFVTVCAIALLLFDVATSQDLRYHMEALSNNNLKQPFETKTAPEGHTFKNHDFDRHPEPPLIPNSRPFYDSNGNLMNVHPDFGIRHPIVPRPPANPTNRIILRGKTSHRGPKSPMVFNSPRRNEADMMDENFSLSDFAEQLDQQYNYVSSSVVQSWLKCNESWRVPLATALKFFINPPWNQTAVSTGAKGLADCTIRRMGVMAYNGFQETEYLVQVKKLMFNYTSFDMNEQSSGTKRMILKTIRERSTAHFDRGEKCFPIGTRVATLKTVSLADVCYELIQSYEQAVRECKNLRHPNGETFETSWMIIECIMKTNRDNLFGGAFYPGLYDEARTVAMHPSALDQLH